MMPIRHIVSILLMVAAAGCAAPNIAGYQSVEAGNESSQASHSPSPLARDGTTPAGAVAPPVAEKSDAAPSATTAALEPRKIIYTGKFTLLAGEVRQAQDAVKSLAEGMGGFMQSLSTEAIIIRIPSARFDEACTKLADLGYIAQREIQAQDVGEAHANLEIRIRNAKALKDKVLDLLSKADDSKHALELEKELARVTVEIEQLEAAFERLNNQIAYASLEIRFVSQSKALPAEVQMRLPFAWLHDLGLNNLMRFD